MHVKNIVNLIQVGIFMQDFPLIELNNKVFARDMDRDEHFFIKCEFNS